jgi:peptidoglycan/LPS O-acetylase OafA/YrhL
VSRIPGISVAPREGSHLQVGLVTRRETVGVASLIIADPATLIIRPTRGEIRIAAFDFVKGVLVLLMVLYHWLNYYIGLQWEGYRYIRFLTPSFIFITGFLISHVQMKRYSHANPQLLRRLLGRGMKLFFLFIVLNVAVDMTVGSRLNIRGSDSSALLATANAVFVYGTGRAAFDILVSIAYFLLLTPIVLVTSQRLNVSLIVVAVVFFVMVATSGMGSRGNPHLEMLAIGLLGLAAGTLRSELVDVLPRSTAVLPSTYLIYLLAITRWNVFFPLQVIGVCLSLLLIYAIALAWGTDGALQRRILRLGQYSLLSYVVQIAVLQCLRTALRGLPVSGPAVFVPLALTVAVTVVVVETARVLRDSSPTVDRLYRAVFA